MDTEERKRRIRHRVDETADQVLRRGTKCVVVAAERDDPVAAAGKTIRLEPRADDDRAGAELAGRAHLMAEPDLAAALLDHPRVGGRDRAVVDDAALGDVERPQAGHVRLDRAKLVRGELGDREPVLAAALRERGEPPLLGGRHRDDELAAEPVGDPVLLGEVDQRRPSLAAETRLQAPGGVVEPGVEDPRVAATLVRGDPVLLVEHGHPQPRPFRKERHRRREAHEPCADDGDVELDVGSAPPLTARGEPLAAPWRTAPSRAAGPGPRPQA